MIVRADDVARTPWRNGGGTTRTLLEDGDRWRIALADIDADGPFSRYPDIARWFAVVAGCVELRFESGWMRLGSADPPLAFDGAAAPDCRLVDGPALALNLLLGDGVRGVMERDPPSGDTPWPLRARYDAGTRTLHGPTAVVHGPAVPAPGAASLWIGIAP